MSYKGWPHTVLSRGRIVVREEKLKVERGSRQVPRARRRRRRSLRHSCGRRSSAQTEEAHRMAETSRSPRPSSARSTRPTPAPPPSKRLVELLREAHGMGAKFVVFPELAFTTFFPRWWMEDQAEVDRRYFEPTMPSAETQPLFDEAKKLGIGFYIGYAELTPEKQPLQHRDPGRPGRRASSASTARSTCPATPSTSPRRRSSTWRRSTSRSATSASASGASWTRSPAC